MASSRCEALKKNKNRINVCKTHVEIVNIHKPRKLRYSEGKKQTPTATYKTQLARLNICSDWGKPHIKQKFDHNLRGLSVYQM